MAHSRHGTRYVRGYVTEGGMWAPTTSHRGRVGSWIAVALIITGFTLAAVSLPLGPDWWLMGAGLIAMALGGLVCLAADIFTDVVLDDPRYDEEEMHSTPLHKIKERQRELSGDA
ncbi:hypothetical protein [Marinactinospora rubrisoli]|uniref:Uncharacterized protein n=1 Tax=Marinactinospora rubrisoli TaxID=2715399 RepID=A0ABW2KE69_9ACTN